MNATSQKARILEALLSGETLTTKDARRLCGADRLGARIRELRKAGWHITTTPRRISKRKIVGEYALEEDTGTKGFRKFIPGQTKRTPDGLSRDMDEVTWGGRR